METYETDIEFSAAVGWVLGHSEREKAFPGWSDQQIKAAYRIFRSEHAAFFFYDDEKQITGTALVSLHPEVSKACVVSVLGDISAVGGALAAWAERCPSWTVLARRRGKHVQYSVRQLCRLIRLSKR
jgi:hypothetical protein